ncbi:MAG: DUF819 domain-containing protein [Candidatus Sumerlaeaceae bacterium]
MASLRKTATKAATFAHGWLVLSTTHFVPRPRPVTLANQAHLRQLHADTLPIEESETLIQDPVGIFIFLAGTVGVIFAVSEWAIFRPIFKFFPPVVFCYFVPMFATTVGLIPSKSSLYDLMNSLLLYPVLILLLLSANYRAILRLGPVALGLMMVGTVGIILGAVLGYAMFAPRLDPQGWKNIGALAASWSGGSANMVAVKGALEIPDKVFAPMFAVDAVMAYTWLGILIFGSSFQTAYARRIGVNTQLQREIEDRVSEWEQAPQRAASTRDLLVLIGLSVLLGRLCLWGGRSVLQWLQQTHPQMPGLSSISASTLGVVFASTLGIVLAFTPVRRLEEVGASRVGYALLYLLLPSFGAQADLRELAQLPWYMAVGAVMLLVHAALILVVMMWLRAPLVFGAVASQANVGGPASASVVASTYQRELAPMGVLLGILGGIIGTYAGLITAALCHVFAPK